MFLIDDALKEFCESGVSALLGTVDAEGRPHLSYAWGPRIHPGGAAVSLYVDRERAGALLAGSDVGAQIAATFTDPVSMRSIQLKGRIIGTGEPDDAERHWVERHRDAFTTTTSLVGDPPHAIRNLWLQGPTVRVDLSVERGFDQTPGPNAGQPL